MSEKKPGWKDLPIGGAITTAGSSAEKDMSGWRSNRPIHHADRCIHCMRCWIFCPDSAIQVEDGKVVGIDYQYCKGCGICAHECPTKEKAITMTQESKAKESEE